MTRLRFSRPPNGRVCLLATALLLILAVPPTGLYGASGPGSFKIFTPKQIAPEQGRKYLVAAGITTVSKLTGSPALLVTGGPEAVAAAEAILELTDSSKLYVVAALDASSGLSSISAARIEAEVGGIAVGTFSSPPPETGRDRAIVDTYKGTTVIVAPRSRFEGIVSAIERLQKAAAAETAPPRPHKPPAEPNEAGPPETSPKIERPADANRPGTPAKTEVTAAPKDRAPTETSTAPAKDAYSIYFPKELPNAQDRLNVTLPEKLDIVNLMGLVGEHLGLNFMYDPLKVKGEVTLMLKGDLRGPVRVGDLYPLLESVMHFKGFAMTRNKNLVTVTPVAEVAPTDPKLIETESDAVDAPGHVVVTRVFKLEHVDTASAQNLLQGMNLGTNISPIENAKMLFVTGYAYRMPRVERLLKMIDKPGKPKDIRFRQLKFTLATALAPKVKTLAEQLGTVSITVGAISAPSGPTTPSARRPGESSAAYAARIAKERAARAQQRTAGAPAAAAAPGVYLDADERTNRILMIGFAEDIDLVEELIDTLDVEQKNLTTLKLYKIEHIDAEQARQKLQELGIISGGGPSSRSSSSSGRITSTGSRAVPTKSPSTPAPSPSPSAAIAGQSELTALVGEPLVVIIEPTNSLLVNATAEQHAQIQTVLEYVDAATEEGTIPYVIYPLENQKPEDLATVLEKLIQETVKDKEGKIERVVKKTEEEIVIVPDENTFSIIVYASKKNQEWIKNLIETLDKRRPQVLIDVTLVEVTKNDKFEYDLNLLESFPDIMTTSGMTEVNTDVVGKLKELLKTTGRDEFVDFQVSSGRGTGFYADEHIQALLTAMQTKDYGRVLAKPKILVNDNEQGTISTTDTTYVTKTSSIPVTSGAGGAQNTLIQTAVDYEGYDAGIQLEITPHISEGQLLRLEITLTRSDFGNITGEKPPDTTSSDIKTVVTVPDGSTIILGGMIKLNQDKGGTKVPFFGDLPLVGALFRSVSNSDLQRRLYIFVKAEIIRPAETLAQGLPDLEKISERNRLAFEKFEQEFQNYQSLPGMKDKPIAPVRVLDTE